MKPMLCHRYAKHKHKLTYPCFIQPKLNGIRMLYCGGSMQSRSHGQVEEKLWADNRLLRIRQYLRQVPDRYILDGEIYRHGWSLQQINGAASINGLQDSEKANELEYHVFDIIDTENLEKPYIERRFLPVNYANAVIKAVPTFLVETEIEGETYFKQFKTDGYEGAIYRDANSPYGFVENCTNQENRWPCILKRKDWLDANCRCIGWQFGEGKYSQCVGSVQLEFENGQTFWAGSGLSDTQREHYSIHDPSGLIFRIKYEMLSDSGVPLKPTIEAILE